MDNDITPNLRIIKYHNGEGKPFTAFVALTHDQLVDFLSDENGNLEPYRQHVLLIVEGHNPSAKEHRDADHAFNHLYGSTAIEPR